MADPKAADLFQRLRTFMREADEWAMPADVLRSAEDAGLAIVSEAERKVLEALRGVDPWDLSDLSESNDCGDDLAGDLRKVIDAELARRSGT